MAKAHLTAARLRQVLSYDPETGDFRWIVSPSQHIHAGDLAGGLITRGYRMIRVDRVKQSAHRLAWLYVHGDWPIGAIDHRNGVKDDNRILNLRIASDEVNHQNLRAPHRDNRTGRLGVYYDPVKERFIAQIRVAKKRYRLGAYRTADEASTAYVEAKRRLHPGCTI